MVELWQLGVNLLLLVPILYLYYHILDIFAWHKQYFLLFKLYLHSHNAYIIMGDDY